MSKEFEEAVMKRFDSLETCLTQLQCKIEMESSILKKSNELIYKTNKENERRLKSIEDI